MNADLTIVLRDNVYSPTVDAPHVWPEEHLSTVNHDFRIRQKNAFTVLKGGLALVLKS